MNDIRWKQRREHFERSFLLLQEAISLEKPSIIERAGIIQFFEMTFELSWKLLKDYLEAEGFRPNSPRETIKQAFQSGLISDGRFWLTALEDRNLTTHTYNEATAVQVVEKIRSDYFPLLENTYHFFHRLD